MEKCGLCGVEASVFHDKDSQCVVALKAKLELMQAELAAAIAAAHPAPGANGDVADRGKL